MDLRVEPSLFSFSNANLLSDLTLLAYLLILMPAMLVGFGFARRKLFVPHHKLTMTTIMLVNWVLIGFVMIYYYNLAVLPEIPERLSDPTYLLPTIHGITGAIAQLLATYLVIRMWFEKTLPKWFMVKRIKPYMRATLTLWLVTAVLGIAIYLNWNVATELAERGIDPAVTPEVQATEEVMSPVATEDVTPAAPVSTEEASPVETEEASIVPVETQEVNDDDDNDDDEPEPVEAEEADDRDDNDDNDDDDNSGRGS